MSEVIADAPQTQAVSVDLGNLLVEDAKSYADVKPEEFAKRTAANICSVYRALFDLKAAQDAKHGADGEILEYTREANVVDMPASTTVLPREKPCPKEEVKTKWEKFREEKGLPARRKRSRLVFDPIQNDWVPRWGKGSIKKLAEKDDWLMHEKPKHVASGLNPFDYARAEKKAKLEKQKLAELKNKVHKSGHSGKDLKVLESTTSLKLKDESERNQLRKRETKSLMKSLQMAQMSTASMGRFDKKLKSEPNAPTSQKLAKKKSNKQLFELDRNRSQEKNRNLKVLDLLQRKREIALGGKVNGNMVGVAATQAKAKAVQKKLMKGRTKTKK